MLWHLSFTWISLPIPLKTSAAAKCNLISQQSSLQLALPSSFSKCFNDNPEITPRECSHSFQWEMSYPVSVLYDSFPP